MGDADVVAAALQFAQLRETDPAWRLLRADNAPAIAAVLAGRLGAEAAPLHLDELIGLVGQDLDALRDVGIDLGRPPRAYVQDWRAAGWITVRPVQGTRAEAVSLTPAGITAIRFLDALDRPMAAATNSRLATIRDRLTLLARESDPDRASRAAALEAERDALTERIEAVRSGGEPTLSEDRALEAVIDILGLAGDIVADFARVREAIDEVNRALRTNALDAGATPGAMIAQTFRGVDQIAESEPGRSFAGFSELITDPAETGRVRAAIAQILERDFSEALTPPERQALARLLPNLMAGTHEIQQVMTAFARALRHLVMSGDYEREGALRRGLRETLADAVDAAARTKANTRLQFELQGSGITLRSVGAQVLTSPQDYDAAEEVQLVSPEPVDFEKLRRRVRLTEIDMKELKSNVNSAVAELGTATVGQVLERYPATQGVASVVGLVVLAMRTGQACPGSEVVSWDSLRGAPRLAEVPLRRFTEAIL